MAAVAEIREGGSPVVVPFELRGNLIVVGASVNDQPARLVFDTGASQTMIDTQAAARAGIQSVERRLARGAGGDIEVAAAGVRSIVLGLAAVSDLTCIVSDISGISEKLGGGIDGVLGFDFNSRFRITIDYGRRELTFVPTQAVAAGRAIVDGLHFRHTGLGLEVTRPDDSWSFDTETPFPQIAVIVKKSSDSASVSIQSQELHGMPLTVLLPDIAQSLSQQFDQIVPIDDAPTTLSGVAAHRFDFRGNQDGEAVRGRLVASVANDRLWTITSLAPPERYDTLASDFQRALDSIRIETKRSRPS